MILIHVSFPAYTWRSSRNPAPKTLFTKWSGGLAHTDMEIAKKWFDRIESHCNFDQLILETSNGRDYWIHVSCRKNKSKNRHQVIRDMRKM